MISPSGEATAGASVRLVGWAGSPYRTHRERPCRVVAATVETGSDGRFVFEAIPVFRPELEYFAIAVSHGSLERSHWLTATGLREEMEIRLGPTREVPIQVRCTQRSEPGPQDSIAYPQTHTGSRPHLTAFWLPGNDRWSSYTFPTAQQPLAPSWLLPNREVAFFDNSASDIARFAMNATLPVGRSVLLFRSRCGFAMREVVVPPGEGPIAVVDVELPHPQAGAIELRSSGDPYARRVVSLWSGDRWVGSYSLIAEESIFIRRLPPGSYHFFGSRGQRCPDAVEVRAGEVTRLILEPRGCEIHDLMHDQDIPGP